VGTKNRRIAGWLLAWLLLLPPLAGAVETVLPLGITWDTPEKQILAILKKEAPGADYLWEGRKSHARADIRNPLGAGTAELMLSWINGRMDKARLQINTTLGFDEAGIGTLDALLARYGQPEMIERNGAPVGVWFQGETGIMLEIDVATRRVLVWYFPRETLTPPAGTSSAESAAANQTADPGPPANRWPVWIILAAVVIGVAVYARRQKNQHPARRPVGF